MVLGPRLNPKGCPTPPYFTLQQSIPNHTPPPTNHISVTYLHIPTSMYPPTHRTRPIPIPGGGLKSIAYRRWSGQGESNSAVYWLEASW